MCVAVHKLRRIVFGRLPGRFLKGSLRDWPLTCGHSLGFLKGQVARELFAELHLLDIEIMTAVRQGYWVGGRGTGGASGKFLAEVNGTFASFRSKSRHVYQSFHVVMSNCRAGNNVAAI